MSTETYAVFAVRYATDQSRRRAANFLGDVPDAPMPMDYFVWALVSDERTIVVDTGFGRDEAKRRKPELLRLPAEGLALIGIEAATVTDVIITHAHYDHAGTIGDFPAARLHIQEAELAFATGRHMTERPHAFAVSTDDAVALVRALFARRLALYDGEAEIAPGISLHRLGGHTPGMQCVRVATARGALVLASDASHYYENMESGVPFSIAFDPGATLAGYGRMRALAAGDGAVVPGHDPLVLARYPAASPALEGEVARLDRGRR